MPKINYLRSIISSLPPEDLQALVEEYAGKEKKFEAFLLEKSGRAVDTGRTYEEYHEELCKILSKCKSKRGYFKVTRLKNAGLESFQKLLNSHFKNENFSTALWMSLALMEMMQEAIRMNTRYKWGNRPYKVFEKIFLETKDRFDTAYKFAKIVRKERPQIFRALMRCWWREQERSCDHNYFEIDNILKYAERDEDLLAIQLYLREIKPREYRVKLDPLLGKLELLEKRVSKELEKW